MISFFFILCCCCYLVIIIAAKRHITLAFFLRYSFLLFFSLLSYLLLSFFPHFFSFFSPSSLPGYIKVNNAPFTFFLPSSFSLSILLCPHIFTLYLFAFSSIYFASFFCHLYIARRRSYCKTKSTSDLYI